MNVLIVDTSSWISYFKGACTQEDEIDLALKEGRVHLPPVVVAELLSSQLRASERTRLQEFLGELPLCDCRLEHWARVGELRAQLFKKGIHVSTPDAHVAQTAMDLEGYLVSEDGIFKKISAHSALKLIH